MNKRNNLIFVLIVVLLIFLFAFPITRGLFIFPFLFPVNFELIKEGENCIQEIDNNFDGVSVLGGDSKDGVFKGDFIFSHTQDGLSIDISCFFNDNILKDNNCAYFFTYNCKLKRASRSLYEEIILSKWPSAVMEYSKPTNDNYLRLYKFRLKGFYWPKG